MDSVSQCKALFKEAFCEIDASLRVKLIIKACKKVSDMLPFSEKANQLTNDHLILENLFTSTIACPSTVTLILESLLQKYKQDSNFMKNFWTSLQYCADLDDYKEQDQASMKQISNRFTVKTTKDLMRDVDIIKEHALKFTQAYFQLIITVHDNPPTLILDAYYEIFVIFIKKSFELSFILKVLSVSRQLRKSYPNNFRNVHSMDEEMEVCKLYVFIKEMMKKPELFNSALKSQKSPNNTLLQERQSIYLYPGQIKQQVEVIEMKEELVQNLDQVQITMEKWFAQSFYYFYFRL